LAQLWLKATINTAALNWAVAGSNGSKAGMKRSIIVIMVLRPTPTLRGQDGGGSSHSDAGSSGYRAPGWVRSGSVGKHPKKGSYRGMGVPPIPEVPFRAAERVQSRIARRMTEPRARLGTTDKTATAKI
jgi:hypothetical protein